MQAAEVEPRCGIRGPRQTQGALGSLRCPLAPTLEWPFCDRRFRALVVRRTICDWRRQLCCSLAARRIESNQWLTTRACLNWRPPCATVRDRLIYSSQSTRCRRSTRCTTRGRGGLNIFKSIHSFCQKNITKTYALFYRWWQSRLSVVLSGLWSHKLHTPPAERCSPEFSIL